MIHEIHGGAPGGPGWRSRVATLLLLVACRACTDAGDDPGIAGDDAAVAPVDAGLDAGESLCAARTARLRASLDALAATLAQPAAVALASRDCPTVTLTSDESVAPGALFRVGSITKTYVAATVVALADEGLLSLDDDLATWSLPVPDAASITVRQLLAHTSGLFSYTEDADFGDPATRLEVQSPAALVAMATAHAPYFAPGTSWRYSNTNYILLGMIVEAVTGAPLVDALHARALTPAGLAHTFFDGGEAVPHLLAPGHDVAGDDVTYFFDPSWPWAAGAMVASAGDVADWTTALYGGDVLSAAARAELTAQPIPIAANLSYGLGTMIVSAAVSGGAGEGIGHGGDIDGYHSFGCFFPVLGASVAAVVTSDADDVNEVLKLGLLALLR